MTFEVCTVVSPKYKVFQDNTLCHLVNSPQYYKCL